jgi:hypothetical protein
MTYLDLVKIGRSMVVGVYKNSIDPIEYLIPNCGLDREVGRLDSIQFHSKYIIHCIIRQIISGSMPAVDAVIENSTNTLHLELVWAKVVAGNDLHIGLENKNCSKNS